MFNPIIQGRFGVKSILAFGALIAVVALACLGY
jgi:hypothetical protein